MAGPRPLVRRASVAAALVTAMSGVLATACGTRTEAPRAVRPPAAVSAPVVVPRGGSPAEARKVGRRMLASLILPAGSHRTAPRSRPPQAGMLAGPNAVDVHRFYWLPLPENVAVRFLEHHVPAASSPAGTGWGPGWHQVDYSLKAPPAGLEHDNTLQATVTVGPHGGTLLRADAELTWYPSRSAAEYLPPNGYRSVTVAASLTVSSGRAKPRTFTRVFTGQAVIARLAGVLDGLHGAPPWTGSCPANLPQFQITFRPAIRGSGRPARVVVSPGGCRGEDITTDGELQPALEDINSMRLFAVIGPLLGMPRSYW
jgi:hypothetical protein